MSSDSYPVLVVDDDPMLADLLATILSNAGYKVIIANSGSDALERVHAYSPCLVLCDMSMPGMSGMDVLRTLHEDPTTADIPFVLMSGALQALDGPRPNAFLQKPFMLAEVLCRVAELTTPEVVAA